MISYEEVDQLKVYIQSVMRCEGHCNNLSALDQKLQEVLQFLQKKSKPFYNLWILGSANKKHQRGTLHISDIKKEYGWNALLPDLKNRLKCANQFEMMITDVLANLQSVVLENDCNLPVFVNVDRIVE